MMRRVPIGIVAAVVLAVPAPLPAQNEVIKGDQPLPSRTEPDQDLTADDFRVRDDLDRGWRLDFVLGCLFLVLVLVLSGIRKRRS